MVRSLLRTLTLLVALVAALPASADDPPSGFGSVDGARIIAPDGSPLVIRGINLGNWLVPEGYMFGFKSATAPWQIQTVFKELVGTEANAAFWRRWYDTYITREDLRFIRSLGMNVVRVPFDYRLFTPEDDPGTWVNTGFTILDRLISLSEQEGLLIILDMHAAPCGQTGRNIDNSYGYPHLFEDPRCQTRMAEVWQRIARRYAGNTTVLGYDLLNEPLPREPETDALKARLEPLYKAIVSKIRAVDPNHLVFLEGAHWSTDFSVFSDIGFDDKLVYEFHFYGGEPNQEAIQRFLDFRKTHQVPIYLGESGENTDAWVNAYRTLLEAHEIGWTFWPYKKMAATSSLRTYAAPPYWDEVVAYQAGPPGHAERRKARPPAAHVAAALDGLIEAVRFANTSANPGYIAALGLPEP